MSPIAYLLTALSLTITMSTQMALASSSSYYDNNTEYELTQGSKRDKELRGYLRHVANKNFKALGYKKRSKKILFGNLHLDKESDGSYFIKGVYCDFMVRDHIGPKKIPINNVMNTEHTWPQSKGAKREPARGDLHHLFPTNSSANSARGNHPFGEVDGKDATRDCPQSQRGDIINPNTGKPTNTYGFQPHPEHRGNVARAMFYVSAKYGYDIPKLEEYYLRKWHKEDPVDQEERERNDGIEEAQGNRNPFIDFPEIVERMENL